MKNSDIINKYINCDGIITDATIDTPVIDKEKPTLLLIDDSNTVVTLLRRLTKKINLDRFFNLIFVTDKTAAFKVLNLLCENDDLIIDAVISDITFGGSVTIDNKNYYFNGIELVKILYEINNDLIYRFITGHNVSIDGTPNYFDQYAAYGRHDNLLDHVEFKDGIITTNISLIHNLLSGSVYENISDKIQ